MSSKTFRNDLDMLDLDNDLTYFFVNDAQKYPALYIQSKQKGSSYLFDIGDIYNLENRYLVKIKYLFISHTHMDHFIGFNSLVRIGVPLIKPLNIFGPKDIHLHIRSSLLSFRWNLLNSDQIRFKVYEIQDSGVKVYDITNTNDFVPTVSKDSIEPPKTFYNPMLPSPAHFIQTLDNGGHIQAVVLDHGIESIAYMYQSPTQFKVCKEAMNDLSLTPGSWILDLKDKVLNNRLDDFIYVDVKGESKQFKVDFLYKEILSIKESKTFSYLTDFYFTESNIQRVKLLSEDSDTMFSESSFMDADYKKAFYKKHLTTKQLALLAAYCNVSNIKCFHISRSYKDKNEVINEIDRFFKEFSILDQDSIKLKIKEELDRISKIE